MKTLVKSLAGVALLACLQSLASAQGPIGYSIADSTQNLYRIDLATGRATNLGNIGTESELEGLASLEGFLLGVGENDPTRPDLPSALWLLNPPLPADEILRTGITFGTEIGAAASPVYGRLVGVVASDDLIPAGQIRTRFYTVTETGTTELGNGSTIYVDGLAITGDGTVYASDFRINDTLYRLELPGGVPTLIPVGPLNIGNPNEDSGLAWDFATGTLWAITEGTGGNPARTWRINPTTGQATLVATVVDEATGLPIPGDFEGLDIPNPPLSAVGKASPFALR